MTYEEYLEVPYVLVVESVPKADGDWTRRASYPELPDCVVEAESILDALDKLDELRGRRIAELLADGRPVPVPRPPLSTPSARLDPRRLDFARWLVDRGRLSDK